VNEARWKYLLMMMAGCGLCLFCLLPFVWMIVVSLSARADFLASGSGFAPTIRNYLDVLTAESVFLLAYMKNSLVVSALSAVLATSVAGFSAYAITRLTFPGRMIIPLIMLGLSMFPQISIVGYLFKMMSGVGWINTYPALVFPYAALGVALALWIMMSYFAQLPQELDKAALIDGAGRLQILVRVVGPLALPGALSAALVVFIYSFNEFLFALMLTIDYRALTIPVGIALFEGLHGQTPWGHIMASAVVATIPMIVVAAGFQRRIVQGLTQGAIKG